MTDIKRGDARQLQMVCTETGYAIIDDYAQVLLELSVAAGQPILHDLYQNPKLPEVASIFLRGIVAGHHAAKGDVPILKPPVSGEEPSDEYITKVLNASPDDYWNPIVVEIEEAGRNIRPAFLVNHQAAHLLFWATISRDAAIRKSKL